MLTLSSQIREGMTVLSTLNPKLPSYEDDRRVLLSIFSAVGRCRFLDEKHFDACTALAGSGPAFACVFLEAMADGGVMMGLPRKEALELAAQCEWSRCGDDDAAADLLLQRCRAQHAWCCSPACTRLRSRTA